MGFPVCLLAGAGAVGDGVAFGAGFAWWGWLGGGGGIGAIGIVVDVVMIDADGIRAEMAIGNGGGGFGRRCVCIMC